MPCVSNWPCSHDWNHQLVLCLVQAHTCYMADGQGEFNFSILCWHAAETAPVFITPLPPRLSLCAEHQDLWATKEESNWDPSALRRMARKGRRHWRNINDLLLVITYKIPGLTAVTPTLNKPVRKTSLPSFADEHIEPVKDATLVGAWAEPSTLCSEHRDLEVIPSWRWEWGSVTDVKGQDPRTFWRVWHLH